MHLERWTLYTDKWNKHLIFKKQLHKSKPSQRPLSTRILKFSMQARQTKKIKKIKPLKQNPIRSSNTEVNIQITYRTKKGKALRSTNREAVPIQSDPDIFPLWNKCSGAFPGEREESSPNEFFQVTSRKCASFCLFPWRLIGGRRGLFLYSPPLEQDTIRC